MEKVTKSVVFEGLALQFREVLFSSPERSFSVHLTQNKDYLVWLFDLSSTRRSFFFDNQKAALTSLADVGCALDLYGEVEVDADTRALVTESVDKQNLAKKLVSSGLIDHEIMSVGISACQIMAVLHEEGKVGNFLAADRIFVDPLGTFKFTDFTLTFEKDVAKVKHPDLVTSKLFSDTNSFAKFSGQENHLEPEEDMVNLGLLLYQLSYNDLTIVREAEDSERLVFPSKPSRSYTIKQVIEACLKPESINRAQPADVMASLMSEQRLDIIEDSGSNDSAIMAHINLQHLEKSPNTNERIKPKFLASFSLLISKATTDTEGWFKSYVEETSLAPDEDFVNKILEKAWRKRCKIKKLYEVIERFLDDQDVLKNSVIVSKILLFFHSIMTKGPVEIMTEQLGTPQKKVQRNLKIVMGSCSYINYLLRKIKAEWEPIAKGGLKSNEDKMRSQALSYLIYFYSIVLVEKSKFGIDYKSIFGGNFSVEPLMKSQDVKEVFSQKTYLDIHGYCSMLLRFFRLLPEDIGLRPIQFGVAKSVTFEIYNLLGVYCHLTAMFKRVAFAVGQVDEQAVSRLIESMEASLDNCIIRFHYSLEDLKSSSGFKVYGDLLPHSSLTAMNEVKKIESLPAPLETFSLEDQFPTNVPIGTFCIPISFGSEESGTRVISPEEKIQIIRRELLKTCRSMDTKTSTSSKANEPAARSKEKSYSAKREFMKPSLTNSEKLLRDADKQEADKDEGKEVQNNPVSQRLKLADRKLPEKVPLMSIAKKDAVKNPYLNASEAEDQDHLEQFMLLEKPQDPKRRYGSKGKSGKRRRSDSNEGEEYDKFEDSLDSSKAEGEAPLLERDGKAFDAKNAMKNEFFKLVPFPIAKEDKEVQCDLDAEALPSSERGFNLERFMREEIANGKKA